jgi:MFS family permease
MGTRAMFRLLRVRPRFRWLWAGVLVSRIGYYFMLVAMSWLLLDISGPRELGLFLMIHGVASALSGPAAGLVIDRFGPRRMVVLDNILRAGLAMTVPMLLWLDLASVPYLYAFGLVTGLLSSITELAQSIVIPALVDDDEVVPATTLMSAIWDASASFGPVSAGLIVAYTGFEPALIVNAATFATMACFALAMPASIVSEETGTAGRRRGMGEGFALLVRLRPVLVVTVASLSLLVVTGILEVSFPVLTREVFQLGPDAYGLMGSIAGVGGLVGTLLLTPRLSRFRPGLAIGLSFALRLVILLPLVLSQQYVVAVVFVLLGSCLDGPLYAMARANLQLQVPMHLRGRVFGAVSVVTSGAFPIGTALAGILLAAYGPVTTIALTVIALTPIGLAIATTRVLDRPALTIPRADEPQEAARQVTAASVEGKDR